MKNEFPGRWRGAREDEEKRNDFLRDGGNDPVLMGHVMVGPVCLPGGRIEILERFARVFEHELVALLSPQPEMLVIGGQVEDVFPEVDSKGPGSLVLDLDREKNVCDPVFFFHHRGRWMKGKRRMGSDGTGGEKKQGQEEKARLADQPCFEMRHRFSFGKKVDSHPQPHPPPQHPPPPDGWVAGGANSDPGTPATALAKEDGIFRRSRLLHFWHSVSPGPVLIDWRTEKVVPQVLQAYS